MSGNVHSKITKRIKHEAHKMLYHRREDLTQNVRNAYLTIAEKTKLEVRETFT